MLGLGEGCKGNIKEVEARGDGPCSWGSKKINAKAPCQCTVIGTKVSPHPWLAAFIPVEENPSEPGVGRTPLILHSGGRDSGSLSSRQLGLYSETLAQ